MPSSRYATADELQVELAEEEFEFLAEPSVVAGAAEDKQYHGGHWPENQYASHRPVENTVEHCVARVSRIEINTYGPGRPEARFIKRIRLAVPPVRESYCQDLWIKIFKRLPARRSCRVVR